jgi:hypothetical protein
MDRGLTERLPAWPAGAQHRYQARFLLILLCGIATGVRAHGPKLDALFAREPRPLDTCPIAWRAGHPPSCRRSTVWIRHRDRPPPSAFQRRRAPTGRGVCPEGDMPLPISRRWRGPIAACGTAFGISGAIALPLARPGCGPCLRPDEVTRNVPGVGQARAASKYRLAIAAGERGVQL